MSETVHTPDKRISVEERMLAVDTLDYETALSLGVEYIERGMQKVPDPSNLQIQPDSLNASYISAMREIADREQEILDAAKRGEVTGLAGELQSKGTSMIKIGSRKSSSPESTRQIALGLRVYKMGTILFSRPQIPAGVKSSA